MITAGHERCHHRGEEDAGAYVHQLPPLAGLEARLMRFCSDQTSTAVSKVTTCSGERNFAAGSQISFQLTLPGSVPLPDRYMGSCASASAVSRSACSSVIGSPLS